MFHKNPKDDLENPPGQIINNIVPNFQEWWKQDGADIAQGCMKKTLAEVAWQAAINWYINHGNK